MHLLAAESSNVRYAYGHALARVAIQYNHRENDLL
jgi:hypothetical protein